MYEFIDVNKFSEGVSLPSEALKINGEFIENQIAGYRTLTVAGREALSPEVSTYETGIRDGSTKKGKRYPARVIRVTYQIRASSNEEFRAAYNKLASILDVEDAELIFNDETDKYFIGTPAAIGEVEPGRNSVVGEFEILCLDPFKYSVLEYEAEPSSGDNSILLEYNGTYKSFPTLRAEFYNEDEAGADGNTATELTGVGDCGYVAFFNENEKIIQLGDPEETEGEDYAKSQTLVNQSFKAASAWGTVSKANWKVNSGITSSSAVEQKGTIGLGIGSFTENSATASTYNKQLIKVVSRAGSPNIHYTVSAKAFDRTANSVKVTIIISTRLDNSHSWFGKGYCLFGSVYIGGAWRPVELKGLDERWEGTSAHTKSVTVTLTGLTENTSSISNIKFKAYRNDGTTGTAGILSDRDCANLAINIYAAPEPNMYYLKSTSYGSGNNWHGASITRVLPADASGAVGATNFTLTYSQKMCIGLGEEAVRQLGAFQALVVSGSGSSRKILAGVNVYKGANGKKANLRFYVNGAVMQTETIDLSYNNKYFKSSKVTTITKTGGTITFNVCGIVRRFYAYGVTNAVANEITFTFSQFSGLPALSYNGLFSVKFVKNNCTTWADIPNKFSANDVVEADCKTGEITLNGVSMPSYGALGNEWEGFYLKPGLNQIGYSYSEWTPAAYAPKVKLKYREVFL